MVSIIYASSEKFTYLKRQTSLCSMEFWWPYALHRLTSFPNLLLFQDTHVPWTLQTSWTSPPPFSRTSFGSVLEPPRIPKPLRLSRSSGTSLTLQTFCTSLTLCTSRDLHYIQGFIKPYLRGNSFNHLFSSNFIMNWHSKSTQNLCTFRGLKKVSNL